VGGRQGFRESAWDDPHHVGKACLDGEDDGKWGFGCKEGSM
jgi:hypothetical protein